MRLEGSARHTFYTGLYSSEQVRLDPVRDWYKSSLSKNLSFDTQNDCQFHLKNILVVYVFWHEAKSMRLSLSVVGSQ